MRKRIFKFYSKILSFALILLGFTSCDDSDEGQDPLVCEYGVPSALYKVKGSILSKETQEPVKNIRAVLVETRQGKEDGYYGDTIFTDDSGKFNLELRTFPLDKVEFNLKIDDIDGELNGSFESKIEGVIFDKPKLTGGEGSWYKGETEKDLGKIELNLNRTNNNP